jgi:Flp pilus assembly protein TadD
MRHLAVSLSGLKPGTFVTLLVLFALPFGGCATLHSSTDRDIMSGMPAGAHTPPTARTLYAMSRILASQGKEEQSELVLLRVIAEYPGFIPAYCDLAEMRLRQGSLEEATQIVSKALEIAPEDPIVLNDAGVCALLQGDYEVALDNFSAAAEIMPREKRYRANMALAMGMMGRYDESLALYKELLPTEDAEYNLNVIREIRTWNTLVGGLERGVRTLTGQAQGQLQTAEQTENVSQ